jgi:hypothetical protein
MEGLFGTEAAFSRRRLDTPHFFMNRRQNATSLLTRFGRPAMLSQSLRDSFAERSHDADDPSRPVSDCERHVASPLGW